MLTRVLKTMLNGVSFRGKARLLHGICPRRGVRQATVFGYEVALDLSEYIQRSVYLEVFEAEETRFFLSVLQPGMTFVDAGANIGYFSLLAASAVGPEGKVFAFEPSPKAYQALRKTVERNQIGQIQCIQAGLGDKVEEMSLYCHQSQANHAPTMVAFDAGEVIKVPVMKLDDFLDQQGVDRVDVMKLDVEGFEPNILRGAQRWLSSGRVGVVLCELNHYWLSENGSSPRMLHDQFVSLGFKAKGPNPDFDLPLQNLIFIRGGG